MTRKSMGRKLLGPKADRRNAAACHTLIRDTAIQMAHETFAALFQKNDWYAALKRANPGVPSEWLEKGWVNEHWPDFIEGARAILAASLKGPMSDVLKDQISEALILDATLIRGRVNGTKILGAAT